ncbi:myosin-binding protein 7-like [Panicum virgatum]|uniref:myosin-binding protein 7-like n=1 Tax=Panicum virgatum TaxID=38727 RepID=UPI0019D6840B|nr:myosin-binding protein 7-like [Panicum virgatum]
MRACRHPPQPPWPAPPNPSLALPLCGHPTSAASPPATSVTPARPPSLLQRAAPPEAPPAVVRVEIGDEAAALREALARQQAALEDLQAELDAERGDASEAMTMILCLQREKAEAMMEAHQFRSYAEEKMAHDAAELAALEDALTKHDAAVRALQR